jgi:DNA-binding transcriptional MerR regulator/methylmalonyl-CoA mutase cobalamin-binding subunit
MSKSESGDTLHPISVVAERTGLSVDVLRAWKRRYGVVVPTRDDTGHRLYSDADVDRLRLLARATMGGRSIGQVMDMATEELAALVRTDETARWTAPVPMSNGDAEGPQEIVERALLRTRAMDAVGLETELARGAAVLGSARFPEAVIAPLFQRVGDGWHRGELSIAQEHLATAAASAVLARLRAALPAIPDAPVLVVATPAGERHELGALLAATVAASEGWRVVYLGPDLPAAEIARAAVRTEARAVGLSVVLASDPERTAAELAALREELPGEMPLLVGGGGAAALEPGLERSGIRFFTALEELRSALRPADRKM